MFLVLAIPAAYLYGAIFTRPQTGELRVWQVVHGTFGLIFVPLALFQLIDVLGGSASPLNTFWIFGVTAALGFYAGAVAGVRVQLLLGSIALIISWSALWDEILADGIGAHYGIYRGLLGLLSIGLLAGALSVWRNNPGGDQVAASATRPAGDLGLWKASELLTGAGIAAVLACSLGVTAVGRAPQPVRKQRRRPDRHQQLLGRPPAPRLDRAGRDRVADRNPRTRLRRVDRSVVLPADRGTRPERGPARALPDGPVAMDPADSRGRRDRAQLLQGGEPRRSAAAAGRDPARPIDEEELARRFLAALSAGDRAAVGELVHPEVEIRTERTSPPRQEGGDGVVRARSSTISSAATSPSRSSTPRAGSSSTPSSSTCGVTAARSATRPGSRSSSASGTGSSRPGT